MKVPGSRPAFPFIFAGGVVLHGCLSSSGSETEPEPERFPEPGNLVLLVQAPVSVPACKLAFRLTSNLKDTLVDTVSAPPSAEGPAYLVEKGFEVPPLRWWNIHVEVLDSADHAFAGGTAGPVPVKSGARDSIVMVLPAPVAGDPEEMILGE